MSITVTMTFDTMAAAVAFMQGQPSDRIVTAPVAAAPAPKAAKPAAAAPAPKAAPPAPAPAAAAAIPYTTLQKAVFELASKDEDKVKALMAEQGNRTFKQLTPEEYPDALARVQAALAEVANAVA